MGEKVLNNYINKGKDLLKELGKKAARALLTNPYFYLVVAIIFVIIIITGTMVDVNAEASTPATEDGLASTSGSLWEQFLKFVLTNEGGTKTDDGKYYIVEDDSAGNPTIGHGLCLKSQDGYLHVDEFSAHEIDSKKLADDWLNNGTQGKVEVEICDAIWKEHLRILYEGIDGESGIKGQYKNLNLKEYQYYALVDVKYRRGNTDGFTDAYNSKWSSSDDKYGEDTSSESFSTDSLYSFFLDGWTDTGSGVYTRKKNQWLLFKYGYYAPIKEYWQETYGKYNVEFDGGINLYNSDGSVNLEKMEELNTYLTKTLLNTKYHDGNSEPQNGPFAKWWADNILSDFQCTWWANGRASQYLELTNSSVGNKYPTTTGHGKDYYNNNQWFKSSKTVPRVNSIISWSKGEYGHVAYVEAVDAKTGDIWISHAGGGNSWYGITKLTKSSGYAPAHSEGTWSGYTLNGFVYLDQPK